MVTHNLGAVWLLSPDLGLHRGLQLLFSSYCREQAENCDDCSCVEVYALTFR